MKQHEAKESRVEAQELKETSFQFRASKSLMKEFDAWATSIGKNRSEAIRDLIKAQAVN